MTWQIDSGAALGVIEFQCVKEPDGAHPGHERMEPVGARRSDAQVQVYFRGGKHVHHRTVGASHATVKRLRDRSNSISSTDIQSDMSRLRRTIRGRDLIRSTLRKWQTSVNDNRVYSQVFSSSLHVSPNC